MDTAADATKKLKLTLIVMNWLRVLKDSDDDKTKQFPLDIIKLIVNIFLYTKSPVKLPFHKEFNGARQWITLSEDNTCATSKGTLRYVLVDIEPIADGVGVFRIQVL